MATSQAQGCLERDPGGVGGCRGPCVGSAHHSAKKPLLGPEMAEGAQLPAGSTPPSAAGQTLCEPRVSPLG